MPPVTEEVDEFLSGALPSDPESALAASFRFAELDLRQAQSAMVVIPADEEDGHFSLSPAAHNLLRAEILEWLQALRDQGVVVTELLSAPLRDQNSRLVADKLLDVAYKTPSKAWMTSLPTGKQVVIAPAAVVEAAGFDGVCRVAHERAIRTAQSHGRPFNTQALAHYESLKPMEVA